MMNEQQISGPKTDPASRQPTGRRKGMIWLSVGFLILAASACLAVSLYDRSHKNADYSSKPSQTQPVSLQTTGPQTTYPRTTSPQTTSSSTADPRTTSPSDVLDPNAGVPIDGSYQGKSHEEIVADLESRQIMVTDKLSSHAVFMSGTKGTAGEWVLENVRQNNIILQAEIIDGDDCIARTAPLQPGQYVESIILLEDIPAGTREVLAYLNYFNRESKAFISRAGFYIKLTVNHERLEGDQQMPDN